jgi:hypothetical protein
LPAPDPGGRGEDRPKKKLRAAVLWAYTGRRHEDCGKCRLDTAEARRIRAERNCGGDQGFERPVDCLGRERGSGRYRLILTQCALSFITPDSWRLLELFNLYRDFNRFPDGKPCLGQSAEMIDAFRIFQRELDAISPREPLTADELIEILNAAFGGKR